MFHCCSRHDKGTALVIYIIITKLGPFLGIGMKRHLLDMYIVNHIKLIQIRHTSNHIPYILAPYGVVCKVSL